MKYRLWVFSLLCLLALLMQAGIAHAGKRAESGVSTGSVNLEVETPHVEWARPLEGGPIRVLFVAPRFTLRDVAELAQRIEIKFDAIPFWSWDRVASEEAPEQEEATLGDFRKAVLSGVDVVVLGNLDCSILPEDILSSITDYVKGGGGLILANVRGSIPDPLGACLTALEPLDSASMVTEGIGESLTPEWPTSLDFVGSGKAGQGRVVMLAYATGRPQTHFVLPALSDPLHARPEYRDVYFSLVARALRWAAGREPDISIERIDFAKPETPNEGEIPPGLPDAYVKRIKDSAVLPQFQNCLVRFRKPAERDYVIEAQVRDPSRGISISYKDLPKLAKGQDTYGIDLPLGPGKYFLDLWIKQKKAVVDWYTAVMPVEQWPRIENLAISKGFLLPNDAVEVTLHVPPDLSRPRACTVWIRAVDSLGRVVSEAYEAVPPEGGDVRVPLRFADLIANLVKVEIFAADTDRPPVGKWVQDRAGYGFVYLPVRSPRAPYAYSFVVKGDAPGEYNSRDFLRTLADCGVDTISSESSDEARFVAADLGFRSIPTLEASHDAGGMAIEQEKSIQDAVKGFWTIGSVCYMVDGVGVRDEQPSANEDSGLLRRFRREIQGKYGDLSALNAAWGSSFADWESCVPIPRDTADDSGNYSSWVDYFSFLDSLLLDNLGQIRGAARRADPDAIVGLNLAPGACHASGAVAGMLRSGLGALVVPCAPGLVERVRSYREPNTYLGMAVGAVPAQGTSAFARWWPWYQVVHGIQAGWGMAPYGTVEGSNSPPLLLPDGTFSQAFSESVRQVKALKGGLGNLLLAAKRVRPEIAIYDSPASHYVNEVLRPLGSDSDEAEAILIRLLDEAGLGFDFVNPNQVESEMPEGYKALFLPLVSALSEAEIRAIEEFASRGGCVLADLSPGLFDENGIRRSSWPLDSLFGVRHKTVSIAAITGEGHVSRAVCADSVSEVSLSETIADSGIEVEGGESRSEVGGHPVWIVSKRGSQLAVLVNHSFKFEENADSGILGCLVRGLLGEVGISPYVLPVTKKGERGGAFEGEVCLSFYGRAEVFVVLSSPWREQSRSEYVLALSKDKHFVELVSGKPVSSSGKARIKMSPGDTAVFAGLPYEVSGVSALAVPDVQTGGRLLVDINIESMEESLGDHLVQLSVKDPDGRVRTEYETEVLCRAGHGQSFVSLALSDPPGFYTVRVRDLLSGVEGQANVRVHSGIAN